MTDTFQKNLIELESPVSNAFEVVPSDTEYLQNTSRGLYIGGEGDLTVEMVGGEQITFAGVVPGLILPIRVVKVLTSTSAQYIVCLY